MTDFEALVRFLVEPFLESPESLKLSCEHLADGKRIWIRLAFDGEDKGRVFGRGGRNIQAIRQVVAAAARLSQCSVNLDVYGDGDHSGGRSGDRSGDRSGNRASDHGGDRSRSRHRPHKRPAPPKPKSP